MSLIKPENYLKKCKDFILCILKAEKEYAEVDVPRSFFCYVVYGSTKIGRIFENEYETFYASNLYDMKKYLNHYTVMQTEGKFHWIGFNVLKNQNWDGKLIKENIIEVDKKSYLICFEGTPSVNGKKFEQYDYTELSPQKKYELDISNGVFGLFTRVDL